MARLIITATEDANGNPSFGTAAEPNTAAAAVPSATAFETALAQLVTDGASPTQAHVTSANNAYTTYKAAVTAYVAAVQGSVSADVTLLVNTANVTKKNQVLIAVRELLNRLVNRTNAFA
jgi:hypothetical protein